MKFTLYLYSSFSINDGPLLAVRVALRNLVTAAVLFVFEATPVEIRILVI